MNWTANLFEAVSDTDLARVKESISKGVDLSAIVDEFDILSAVIAWSDHTDIVRRGTSRQIIELLIKSGANPNRRSADGTTALYWAAFTNDHELVKRFIQAGAGVKSERPEDGHTSLHEASEQGNLEVVELLLKAGGKAVLNKFDYISRTPLMWAVDKGYIEIARALIEAGSDVNAHDEPQIGDTALRVASKEGSFELARLLVEAGADPLIPGWMGIRALDVALDRSDPEGRKILELFKKIQRQV